MRPRARGLLVGLIGTALLMRTAAAQCPGDCDGSGTISVDELVSGVAIAVGQIDVTACSELDGDRDGAVSADELIRAVRFALSGCPATATPSRTATATRTPSPTLDTRATIEMDLRRSGGYLSFPWPNDIRKRPDGTLDMAGFPGTQNPIAAVVYDRGSRVTTGFGTNAAVYFQTSGAIDPTSLPAAPQTLEDGAALMLVDLDHPQAPRVPLLVHFYESAGVIRPGRLLAMLPYPGHPLRESTRYAAIVFAGVRDASGGSLRPAPLIAELAQQWNSSRPVERAQWEALQMQRAAVLEYVARRTTWNSEQVVGFTVFTTQEITSSMRALVAAVNALPAPAPVSRGVGDCSAGKEKTTVRGLLDLPKWQQGPFPYLSEGGGLVIENGVAQLQSIEPVAFEMTFPCGPAPEAGWPILLFMDGTGASASSDPIRELGSSTLPYLVGSIAPLYSGDRQPQGLPVPFDQSEIVFFNYLNPVAGRTNQLQQASEMIYLRRVLEGIVLSAEETGAGRDVPSDDDVVVIGGHSQGALTIPQALAFDEAFDAAFVSAGGAGFYHSLIHRGDVRALIDSLLGLPPTEFEMFHPALHGLQALAEIGDAANYAPFVRHAHVLSTAGVKDGCSILEVTAHLSTAFGTPVANPLHFPVFGFASLETGIVALPVAANLPDGRTFATIQLDTGHFGAHTNPSLGRNFVESFAAGGIPRIDPDSVLADDTPGCDGRADPLPERGP